MAKVRTIYACQNCGAQSPKWLGRCPECGKWNTFVEEIQEAAASRSPLPENNTTPLLLSDIKGDEGRHIPTKIEELDRVLGGGYVPGSLNLIGGDPGIGKSTILMQAFAQISKRGEKILYVSGEESGAQIKLRADRLGVGANQLYIYAENSIERIIEQIKKLRPSVVAIDSIQTVYTNDIQSAPGTISQVRECAGKLLMLCKGSATACFLVGHVTKDGAIAGPKVLEHMVDAVLYFEGERGHAYRILRTIKNRFGSTNEIGVFEMTGEGLQEVKNPSGIFLAERAQASAGSAVVSSLEGSRPVLLEVQALVSGSGLANPRRTAIGIESARMNLLVAVLDKIAGIQLHDQDIFVNVAGGIRITEPASDLGVLAAIHSSFLNRAINHETILIGEVGLTGEVRAVSGIDVRLKEAQKMGFTRAIVPKSSLKAKLPTTIEVIGVANIEESIHATI